MNNSVTCISTRAFSEPATRLGENAILTVFYARQSRVACGRGVLQARHPRGDVPRARRIKNAAAMVSKRSRLRELEVVILGGLVWSARRSPNLIPALSMHIGGAWIHPRVELPPIGSAIALNPRMSPARSGCGRLSQAAAVFRDAKDADRPLPFAFVCKNDSGRGHAVR